MKVLKLNFLLMILLSIFYLDGCSNINLTNDEVEDGLVINTISISYGGEPNNTLVSYNFNIWNKTKRTITIKSVEPVIPDNLNNRIDKTKLKNVINRTINGGSGEIINGSFNVDTLGLDKDEIIALNIELKKFNITTEQEIGIEMNK